MNSKSLQVFEDHSKSREKEEVIVETLRFEFIKKKKKLRHNKVILLLKGFQRLKKRGKKGISDEERNGHKLACEQCQIISECFESSMLPCTFNSKNLRWCFL